MDVKPYLNAISARWLIVLLSVVSMIVLVVAFSGSGFSAQFEAKSRLTFSSRVAAISLGDNVGIRSVPALSPQSLVDLVGGESLAELVSRRPDVSIDAQSVQRMLTITTDPSTQVITFTAVAEEPDVAVAVANAAGEEMYAIGSTLPQNIAEDARANLALRLDAVNQEIGSLQDRTASEGQSQETSYQLDVALAEHEALLQEYARQDVALQVDPVLGHFSPATETSWQEIRRVPGMFLALGLTLGLALGLTIAFTVELADSSISAVDVAAYALGAPVAGYLGDTTTRPDVIRRARQFMSPGDGRGVAGVWLLVPLRADATISLVAEELAFSLQRQGKRVALVFSDPRGKIQYVPTARVPVGTLIDLLDYPSEITERALGHDVAVFSPVSDPELVDEVASPRFTEAVTLLRARHDVVLLVTAPAVMVDAIALSPLADGVLVVAEAYVSDQDEALDFRSRLCAADSEVTAVLLTGTRRPRERALPMRTRARLKP